MSEKLDSADLVKFQEAMGRVDKALSVVGFLQKVFVAKYGLKDGDNIELDGTIVRSEDRAAHILDQVKEEIPWPTQNPPN